MQQTDLKGEQHDARLGGKGYLLRIMQEIEIWQYW